MKKKIVTLLLGTVLALSITGCGGEEIKKSDKQFDLSNLPTQENVFDASISVKEDNSNNQIANLTVTEDITEPDSNFIIKDETVYEEESVGEENVEEEISEIKDDTEFILDTETSEDIDFQKYMKEFEDSQLGKIVRIEGKDDSYYVQEATTVIEMPAREDMSEGYSCVLTNDDRGYEYSINGSDGYLVIKTGDETKAYHCAETMDSSTFTTSKIPYVYTFIGKAIIKGDEYIVVKGVDDTEVGELGYYFFVNPSNYSLSYEVPIDSGLPSSYEDLAIVTTKDSVTDLSKEDYDFEDVSYEELTSKMFEALSSITKQ